MINLNKVMQTWSDIQKAKVLLENLIYANKPDADKLERPDLNDMKIMEKIDDDIKIYLGLADKLGVRVTDIVRIRIEYVILKEVELDKQELDELIGKFKNKEKTIKVDNCFVVQKKSEKLVTYLNEIWEQKIIDKQTDVDCLCPVEIGEGFVAPCYLVTGPLRKFEDDWPKISKEFDNSLKVASKIPRRLQSLLSSNFATWIAWGPSIPICQCAQWGYHESDIMVTLQYGFIDENNSLPLLLPDHDESKYIEKIFGKEKNRISEIIVRKVKIIVKPSLLSKETMKKLAHAIKGKEEEREEFVLKLNNLNDIKLIGAPKIKKIKDSIGYYTAYVWILFGVIKPGENSKEFINKFDLYHPENQYVWRNLLPFFEHVNLADPLAYERQKKLLVLKALSFIKDYLKAPEDTQTQQLKFIYLCAFDHPNCGKDDKGEDHQLILNPKPGKSIKDILEELKNKDDYKNIPIEISPSAGSISSCHLTELIHQLNRYLKDL